MTGGSKHEHGRLTDAPGNGAWEQGRPQPFGEREQRAARSDCTILITGETGVGKGYLAKWIHQYSGRRSRPFAPVNCGAMPESIIDSQLFGHAKGAFSGATSDHPGLVRAAAGGTLFLDEVGELPPTAQIRLLRLLQDREVQPVGHPRPMIVDVRVIAATNSDLHEAVQRRAFREDLMFRLDVIRLHVPPLRERLGELEDLLQQFNREFAELYQQEELLFDPEAMQIMRSHPWPGNIRQLRTVVERLHVLCPDRPVGAGELIDIGQLRDATGGHSRLGSIDRMRREEVLRVIREHGGSISRAAAAFGVHRSTIYRWLQRHRGTSEQSAANHEGSES